MERPRLAALVGPRAEQPRHRAQPRDLLAHKDAVGRGQHLLDAHRLALRRRRERGLQTRKAQALAQPEGHRGRIDLHAGTNDSRTRPIRLPARRRRRSRASCPGASRHHANAHRAIRSLREGPFEARREGPSGKRQGRFVRAAIVCVEEEQDVVLDGEGDVTVTLRVARRGRRCARPAARPSAHETNDVQRFISFGQPKIRPHPPTPIKKRSGVENTWRRITPPSPTAWMREANPWLSGRQANSL